MLRLSSTCALLAVAAGILPLDAAVLTNASDVAAVLIDERRPVGDRFDLCGQVLLLSSGRYKTLILGNSDGNTLLHFTPDDKHFDTLAIGDIIRVTGITLKDHRDMNATRCEKLTVLRHGTPPPPLPVSGDDILSGKVDFSADGYPRWKNRCYRFVQPLDLTKSNRPPSHYQPHQHQRTKNAK